MKKACPYCGSRERTRVKRPRILKLVPCSAMYRCSDCDAKYYCLTLLKLSFKFKPPIVYKSY